MKTEDVEDCYQGQTQHQRVNHQDVAFATDPDSKSFVVVIVCFASSSPLSVVRPALFLLGKLGHRTPARTSEHKKADIASVLIKIK